MSKFTYAESHNKKHSCNIIDKEGIFIADKMKKAHLDERMLVLSPDRDTLLKRKHSKKTKENLRNE